jgi:type IV secretory pathway VirB4 component
MNKFYVIFPAFLLIVFCVYYTQIAKPEMAEKARVEERKAEDQRVADEARRKEIEEKAQADAQKQTQAREAKDRATKERIQREKDEQDGKTKEDTEKYESQAASLNKQISDLEKEIANLRARREALVRDVFAAAAKVEMAKIDRNNAELEIQRMYEMVAQKVGESSLSKLPPPQPAK